MVENTLSWLAEHFLHPWLLAGLGLVPVVIGLSLWRQRRRRRALRQFSGRQALFLLLPGRRSWVLMAPLLAFALLALGSAGPRWGQDRSAVKNQARDLTVVLDISRSMLAEDGALERRLRSRLFRAKHYLRDLAGTLQQHGGYRLGLVVFAGQARLSCPPTEDYDHFLYALNEASPYALTEDERLGAGSQGTRLRQGIELAAAHQDPDFQGFQDILLISDGEDLAGDWETGADKARSAGLAVHVLAVGDPRNAHPLYDPQGVALKDSSGAELRTRRDDTPLQAIAKMTGGEFLAEELSPRPLVQWFETHIRPLPARSWSGESRPGQAHQFFWFFAAALMLLLAEMLLGDGSRMTR
jgi:Ca-activated chloride channel family protein